MSKKRAYGDDGDGDGNGHDDDDDVIDVSYDRMTVAQLKQRLVERGISITGKKGELIKVLQQTDTAAAKKRKIGNGGGGGRGGGAAAAAMAAAGGGAAGDAGDDDDESWKKTIECCICLEMMLPPIMNCQNGHGVCQACCKQIDKCPQCQVSMATPTRCRMLENVFSMKKVECGVCEETVTLGEYEQHVKSHIVLCCKAHNCAFTTRHTKQLVRHMVDVHQLSVWDVVGKIKWLNCSSDPNTVGHGLIKYQEQHFYLSFNDRTWRNKNIVDVSMWSLESGHKLNNAVHSGFTKLRVGTGYDNGWNDSHSFKLSAAVAGEQVDGREQTRGHMSGDRQEWIEMSREAGAKDDNVHVCVVFPA